MLDVLVSIRRDRERLYTFNVDELARWGLHRDSLAVEARGVAVSYSMLSCLPHRHSVTRMLDFRWAAQ
jgi:hypothetical protein